MPFFFHFLEIVTLNTETDYVGLNSFCVDTNDFFANSMASDWLDLIPSNQSIVAFLRRVLLHILTRFWTRISEDLHRKI